MVSPTLAAPAKAAPVRTAGAAKPPRRAEPVLHHPPGEGEQRDALVEAGGLLRQLQTWLRQLEQAEAAGWRFTGVELIEASAPDEPWQPLRRRPLASPTAFLPELEDALSAIALALGGPIAGEPGRAPSVRVVGSAPAATKPIPPGSSARPRSRRQPWRRAPVWCGPLKPQPCRHASGCGCQWWQLRLLG